MKNSIKTLQNLVGDLSSFNKEILHEEAGREIICHKIYIFLHDNECSNDSIGNEIFLGDWNKVRYLLANLIDQLRHNSVDCKSDFEKILSMLIKHYNFVIEKEISLLNLQISDLKMEQSKINFTASLTNDLSQW